MKTLLEFSQKDIQDQIVFFLEKENDCILVENKKNSIYSSMGTQNSMGSLVRNNPFHYTQPISKLGGLCSGLITLILYGLALTLFDKNPTKPRNDYPWFMDVLRTLRLGSDNGFKGLQEAERNAIMEFISHVLFFQAEALNILKIPQGRLDKNADRDTKGRTFFCEYTLAGTFTAKLLAEKLPDIVHDGRIVLVGSGRHATGLIRDGNQYFFVNRGIYTSENAQEIANKIFEDYAFYKLDKDSNLSLTFQCFSLTELELSPQQTPYKAQKELLTGLPTKSALYHAASIGCIASAKFLLDDTTIDINKENGNKKTTPLYMACQNGHKAVVELLLQRKGIDINKGEELRATPLYMSCQIGHKEIVELLLQTEGIDINQPAETGATPLYMACQNGHIEIVKLLLKKEDVAINQATKFGATPLYIACYQKHNEIVELLLQKHNENAKKTGVGFQMVLDTINVISDNNSKVAIKNKLIELIKCLPFEDLVNLSKIMYRIQNENIISDKIPSTNIDIKNIVFLRKEMGLFIVSGSHGNTTTWQEVMRVLKEQIKCQMLANMTSKTFSFKYNGQEHYNSCLVVLSFNHSRTKSNTETADQKWIADTLKVDDEKSYYAIK